MPIRRAIGVLGSPERAEVDERGALHATDCAWRLDWWIGDGDRWRDPSVDPVGPPSGGRRRRPCSRPRSGSPPEMCVRGCSARSTAASSRRSRSRTTRRCPWRSRSRCEATARRSLSPRGATAVPLPEGTDGPPADAAVFPLAHHAVLRVALPLTRGMNDWPARLPTSAQVAAGWRAVDERGERIDAPGTLPGAFALARAQLLLGVARRPRDRAAHDRGSLAALERLV